MPYTGQQNGCGRFAQGAYGISGLNRHTHGILPHLHGGFAGGHGGGHTGAYAQRHGAQPHTGQLCMFSCSQYFMRLYIGLGGGQHIGLQ